MNRAVFSPIVRSTWLYLQYLVVFTQAAAGWCLEWVKTKHTPHILHSSVSTHPWHQPTATWVNTTRYCKVQSSASDDGRKQRPIHVQLTWNNKLIYIVYLTRLTIYTVLFQLIRDTNPQLLGWTLPDTVNTDKCSWWLAKTLPETGRADKQK